VLFAQYQSQMFGTSSVVSLILLGCLVVPWLNVQTRRDASQAGVDLDDEPGNEGAVKKQVPDSKDDIISPGPGEAGNDENYFLSSFLDVEIAPGGGAYPETHANSNHHDSHKEGMEIKDHTGLNSAHGAGATSLVGKSDVKGVHESSSHVIEESIGVDTKDRTGPKLTHATGATSLMISNDGVGVHGAKTGALLDAEEHALVKAFTKEHMLVNVDANAEIATNEAHKTFVANAGGKTAKEKWRPTFEALRKDHHGKVHLDDYISFQAGSFGQTVQEKFRKLAHEFVSDGGLDLNAFTQLKASEEKHEKVLALTMFQSLDDDHDGRITVDDLIKWTRTDAKQHNVELDSAQENYFKDQYQSHADATSTLDFEAFTRTGLTKLVINSYLEEEK